MVDTDDESDYVPTNEEMQGGDDDPDSHSAYSTGVDSGYTTGATTGAHLGCQAAAQAWACGGPMWLVAVAIHAA